MANESDIFRSILGALVKSVKSGDADPTPEIHLYLNEPENKITITVDYPIKTDIEKVGISLLDTVKEKLEEVK